MPSRPSLPRNFILILTVVGAVYGRADSTDAPCAKPPAVAFAKGGSAAKYHGGFERGEMDCWTVTAKAGQTLTVKVEAIEKNASFDIYLPQYQIVKSEDGLDVKGGRLTPGGDGDRHIAKWSGVLPVDGRYLINVLSERGNVTYDLRVAVTGK
jgi:hypothetical protein